MTRFVQLLIISMVLAACAGREMINLEARDIAVQQNAEPASGGVGVSTVSHLLPATSPTYVTLAVSQVSDGKSGSKTETSRRAITSGSGFIAESSGYVLTAAHVAVAKDNHVSARAADGRVYSGTVISISPGSDMAIIKLRGYLGKAVAPAQPGCSNKGDLVYTLGKPHAQGDTARIGVIESHHFGRAVAYGKFGYPDAMVLRMRTQKGESGGPLFNDKGRLIGMVVSTLSDANGQSINLAHAVPATALANFLCSQTSCSTAWAALSSQNTDSCPNAT